MFKTFVSLLSGNVMNRQNVTKWCREFSEGRTNDEQRSSRPSLMSDDLLQEIEGEIRGDGRVTIRELHRIIPEVSKTTIHDAATEKLGYRKLWCKKNHDALQKGLGDAEAGSKT
jgi:transposase